MSKIIPFPTKAARLHRRTRKRQHSRPFTVPWYLWLPVLVVVYVALNPAGIVPQFPGLPDHTLTGRVTHVRDGDTIEVSGVAIRLAKLDCAELGTSRGLVAKDRMRRLVRGQQMTCRLEGRKSYDREVGECALSDGRDVGEVMISGGFCDRWSW